MIRFNDFESNNTKYHVTKQNGLISELGVVTLLFGVSIFWGFPPEKRAPQEKVNATRTGLVRLLVPLTFSVFLRINLVNYDIP